MLVFEFLFEDFVTVCARVCVSSQVWPRGWSQVSEVCVMVWVRLCTASSSSSSTWSWTTWSRQQEDPHRAQRCTQTHLCHLTWAQRVPTAFWVYGVLLHNASDPGRVSLCRSSESTCVICFSELNYSLLQSVDLREAQTRSSPQFSGHYWRLSAPSLSLVKFDLTFIKRRLPEHNIYIY